MGMCDMGLRAWIDKATGEDMMSSAYKPEFPEEYGGFVAKVKAEWKEYSNKGEVFSTGSKASAEEAAEADDEHTERALDLVHNFNLVRIDFIKKRTDLADILKEKKPCFEKCVRESVEDSYEMSKKTPEEVEQAVQENLAAWNKGYKAFLMAIPTKKENFKNMDFYWGPKANIEEGSIMFYHGDDTGNFCYYVKDLY